MITVKFSHFREILTNKFDNLDDAVSEAVVKLAAVSATKPIEILDDNGLTLWETDIGTIRPSEPSIEGLVNLLKKERPNEPKYTGWEKGIMDKFISAGKNSIIKKQRLMNILDTAARFYRWKVESGQILTYPMFIKDFGYEASDGEDVKTTYDQVMKVITQATVVPA